jgi:hypothetical protein
MAGIFAPRRATGPPAGDLAPAGRLVGEDGSGVASVYTDAAGWSSLVARRAHNPKVAGSNPAPAIEKAPEIGAFFFGRGPVGARPGYQLGTNFRSRRRRGIGTAPAADEVSVEREAEPASAADTCTAME